MGFFSFLFAPPAPSVPAPHMSLRRFYPVASVPPVDYTVIDLETSGLDACTSEILEIGAIQYRNHEEVSRYHTFIRPEGYIPAAASNVNNITWRKVFNAPKLEDVAPAFWEFIGADVLLGYNVGFDIKFIQTRSGTDIPNNGYDVLSFVRDVLPGLGGYKLTDVRSHFSIYGPAHSAIGDCEATAQVYQKCLDIQGGKLITPGR